MDEFQEMGFRILAGSIGILRTYPLIVLKAINSNSESIANHCSKNPSGGQDKPAGIGCPPPIIEGILSD